MHIIYQCICRSFDRCGSSPAALSFQRTQALRCSFEYFCKDGATAQQTEGGRYEYTYGFEILKFLSVILVFGCSFVIVCHDTCWLSAHMQHQWSFGVEVAARGNYHNFIVLLVVVIIIN